MSPLLDEALANLGEKDRQALLLRFFENRSLAQIGVYLGTNENTAGRRVTRALEKLHRYLLKRGVVATTVVIGGAISAHSVHAAPVGLTTVISSAGVTKGAAACGSTLTLVKGGLKLMAWTKAKIAAVGACVLLTAGTTTFVVKELVQHSKHTNRVEVVAEFDWKKMAANRQLLRGEVVQLAGQTVLKIHETNKVPTVWNLFNVQAPPITAMNYAITGEIKYDGVAEDGYLATWNYFSPLKAGLQESQYYSYTGDLDGPQKKINGSSEWRTFSLPLDRATGNYSTPPSPPFDPATTAHPPTHINVFSFLPGGGLLYLRNVKLTQWTENKKMTNRIEVSESK